MTSRPPRSTQALPDPPLSAIGLSRWHRLGRRFWVVLLVLCLPLQGVASARGRIDEVAHFHRAMPMQPGPLRSVQAVVLPPELPVLLSVDGLHNSHGSGPGRVHRATPLRAHHHAAIAHHHHGADDASVVKVDDPATDAPAHGGGKRLLLDVDTPPTLTIGLAAARPLMPPPVAAAARLPEPEPDRLERPPRPALV